LAFETQDMIAMTMRADHDVDARLAAFFEVSDDLGHDFLEGPRFRRPRGVDAAVDQDLPRAVGPGEREEEGVAESDVVHSRRGRARRRDPRPKRPAAWPTSLASPATRRTP